MENPQKIKIDLSDEQAVPLPGTYKRFESRDLK